MPYIHPILAKHLLRRMPPPQRDHRIARNGPNEFTLYWTVEYRATRPERIIARIQERTTDYVGAVQFAKKWRLPIPTPY